MSNGHYSKKKYYENMIEEEVEGAIRVPVAPLIYKCLDRAFYYGAWKSHPVFRQVFIDNVESLEMAAQHPLLRKDHFSEEGAQEVLKIIQRYRVSLGSIGPGYPRQVKDAEAKLRRLIFLLKPILDYSSVVQYDRGIAPPDSPDIPE